LADNMPRSLSGRQRSHTDSRASLRGADAFPRERAGPL